MVTLDIAGTTRPRPDQAVGGDFTFIKQNDASAWVLCMDVLGHGAAAHEVVGKVAPYLDELEQFDLIDILTELNQRLKGGRGAAISICRIDKLNQVMHFVGVGNVSVRKLYPTSQSLVSKDGVVGEHLYNPQVQQVPLNEGDIYLLHTDGIQNRFSLSQYRQIIFDSATRAASHILRNFSKVHDDAGCIVIKVQP